MKNALAWGDSNINMIRTGPRGATPVVLVHAVGMDLTLWGQQIELLQKTYDVVALDLPGHGLSEKIDGELSFTKFAAVLSRVIEGLECGPVHLVGLSFGGMVIQTVAIERPELVRSLSLIGTASTFTDAVRAALRERAMFVRREGMRAVAPLSLARWFTPGFSKRRPDVLDRVKKTLYRQDQSYHAAIWEIISELNTEHQLHELSLPVQVIVGEDDFSTPVSSAQILAEALGTKRLHIVPGSSHFTNLEAPEIVNDLLLSFFNSFS